MTALSRYTWVLHLACIAICCFFLAQTVTTFIGGMLEGAPVELTPRVEEAAPQPAPKEEEGAEGAYKVIAERNIFNSAASGEVKEVSGEEISPEMLGELGPAVKTSLDVKVLGTLVIGEGTDRRSSTTVSGGSAKGAEVFYVGDEKSFSPNVKLTKVARDRIEFINGNRLEFAELEDFAAKKSIFASAEEVHGKGGPIGAKETPESSEPTAEGKAGGKIFLEQKEIEEALGNLDRLYTEIRIVPNFKDGRAAGYKVLSIKPGSVVSKLRIQRGDILERINGEELSVQKGMELFSMLKDQKNFNIDLVRRGQNTTLEYEIR